MNFHKYCFFDFETDGPNPHECEPVQLAAIIIDPRKLHEISQFESMMQPVGINEPNYREKHEDTIGFHSNNYGCTNDEIFESWQKAPDQKQVWATFTQWLSKYHIRQANQSMFSAPIPCGYNILRFDMHIIDRLSHRYGNINKDGETQVFHQRDKVDMMDKIFWWFENENELNNHKMDTLRDYFGLPTTGAHNALIDVQQGSMMMVKFLKTQRWVTETLIKQDKLRKGLSHVN